MLYWYLVTALATGAAGKNSILALSLSGEIALIVGATGAPRFTAVATLADQALTIFDGLETTAARTCAS